MIEFKTTARYGKPLYILKGEDGAVEWRFEGGRTPTLHLHRVIDLYAEGEEHGYDCPVVGRKCWSDAGTLMGQRKQVFEAGDECAIETYMREEYETLRVEVEDHRKAQVQA